MNKTAEVIKATADPDANVIWGHVIDPDIGDSMRVTLIATGFPEGKVKPNVVKQPNINTNTNASFNANANQVPPVQLQQEEPMPPRQATHGVRPPQQVVRPQQGVGGGMTDRAPIRSFYRPATRTPSTLNDGFEESRLQTPNDDRDASHGLPRMNYDQPAIYRRSFKN